MSEADSSDYDGQVRTIQAANQPLLDAFEVWLKQANLSQKTIETHISNINFFTHYLVYYEPLKKLDETTESGVWMFLADWSAKSIVGLCDQRQVLSRIVQEVLPMDGRNRSCLSPGRC